MRRGPFLFALAVVLPSARRVESAVTIDWTPSLQMCRSASLKGFIMTFNEKPSGGGMPIVEMTTSLRFPVGVERVLETAAWSRISPVMMRRLGGALSSLRRARTLAGVRHRTVHWNDARRHSLSMLSPEPPVEPKMLMDGPA